MNKARLGSFLSQESNIAFGLVFEGLPVLYRLPATAGDPEIAGAHVRIRWNVPEEDRQAVDCDAIEANFGTAAVKLEGRVVPVVRTRAAGISQAASVGAKVEAWALATATQAAPLLPALRQSMSGHLRP